MSIGVRIQWLGHSTFLLTGADDGPRVLVEAFVQSNPACPEEARRLQRIDAIALTHAHFDHVADVFDLYREYEPEAVVAMVELAAWLKSRDLPEERVIDCNKGGTVEVAGVSVTLVDANHSAGILDADPVGYGGQPAGLVLEFPGGGRVYHAGDTNVFGDMALIGELYRPDVALLPIGDRYTMGPREAAKACELLGVERMIPMHYGTWPVLTGTPDALRDECARRGLDVEVIALEPGESWE